MLEDVKLTCPYTGAAVTPKFVPFVGWVAQGAFDPCVYQDAVKLEATLRAASPARGPLRCAYTGKAVSLEFSGALAKAGKALCPGVVWEEKVQLLYDLSRRPGKLPAFERDPVPPKIFVGDVRRPNSNPAAGYDSKRSATVDNIVEGILKE